MNQCDSLTIISFCWCCLLLCVFRYHQEVKLPVSTSLLETSF